MSSRDDDEPQAGGPAMTNDEVWDMLLAHRHPRMVAALAEEYAQGYADGYRDGYDPASRLKAEEIAYRAAAREERAKIVAWLRTHPMNKHAMEWADIIEACEDETEDPREAGFRLRFAASCGQ